jgi:hypothetical protein
MFFSQSYSVARFFEIRSRDHEFLTSNILCTLEDIFEIIFMSMLSVVVSTEDRVSEVYADLVTIVSLLGLSSMKD